MLKKFPNLIKGQRIEVYLHNGEIREGTFSKWMPLEDGNYLIVDQDDRFVKGKYITGSWFMCERSVKLIYPLEY